MDHTPDDLDSVVKRFIDKLQKAIDLDEKPDPNVIGIYEFEICGPDNTNGSSFFCTVDLKKSRVYAGKALDASQFDCRYLINKDDFIKLLEGRLEFAQAYLTGRLKVIGNSASAFKFQRFLKEKLTPNSDPINDGPSPLITLDIPTDGLKSDVIFEMIKKRLSTESDLVKQIQFVVQVNLTKSLNDGRAEQVAIWTLDTKNNGGRIYRSAVLDGNKADAILTIDDNHFVEILFGKLNPQRLFISGKMKIKGNIMLLQKLLQFWNRILASHQGADYPLVKEILLNTQLKSGLQSELAFFFLLPRLVDLSQFDHQKIINSEFMIGFVITKRTIPQVKWALAYDRQLRLCTVHHEHLVDRPSQQPDKNLQSNPGIPLAVDLVIEDRDFAHLVMVPQTFDLQAISPRRVRFSGDPGLVLVLIKLFETKSGSGSTANTLKAKL